MHTLVIFSGGLDSTTLAYYLRAQGHEIELLSFDYGQRHARELEAARRIGDLLGVPWDRISLADLGALLVGTALTDPGVSVPEGHYADVSMRLTVVPNRNAVMLAAGVAVAAARKMDAVAIGIHAGDHPIYPDCRPSFIERFNQMEKDALGEWWQVRVIAPFIDKTKGEIVVIGAGIGVPFSLTWSCYKGGDLHCGVCGTCMERKEAFQLAGVPDPTEYRDVHYLKRVSLFGQSHPQRAGAGTPLLSPAWA